MPSRRITGIDVSHWQGRVDWKQVAASGERFAFVKATEGVGHMDKRFHSNVEHAHAAGLDVGVYHFARPSEDRATSLEADARAEARYFTKQVRGTEDLLTLGYVLDLEKTTLTRSEDTVQWADIFCEEVQLQTDRRPIVYVGPNFWRWKLARSNRLFDLPLWLVRYKGSPSGVPTEDQLPTRAIPGWRTTFWQWTSKGKVPGVATPCDRNVFMGHELQYQTFKKEQAKPPEDAYRLCWQPNPATALEVAISKLMNWTRALGQGGTKR